MTLSNRRECFCSLCKTPRKIYKNKSLGFFSIMGLSGLTALMTYIIWGSLDIRGLSILAVLLLGGELFSQIKWRQSMICTNCGFDVVLYKRDPDQAGLKVKEFLALRSERPEFLLRQALQLPKQKQRSAPNPEKGKNLSLQG